jgi:hypothetical protein
MKALHFRETFPEIMEMRSQVDTNLASDFRSPFRERKEAYVRAR